MRVDPLRDLLLPPRAAIRPPGALLAICLLAILAVTTTTAGLPLAGFALWLLLWLLPGATTSPAATASALLLLATALARRITGCLRRLLAGLLLVPLLCTLGAGPPSPATAVLTARTLVRLILLRRLSLLVLFAQRLRTPEA